MEKENEVRKLFLVTKEKDFDNADSNWIRKDILIIWRYCFLHLFFYSLTFKIQ